MTAQTTAPDPTADLLATAVTAACEELLEEVPRVPLSHWNESVFRFYVVRHLLGSNPGLDCRTEWNRVDLLLPSPNGAALVEFKFFGRQPLCDHAGRVIRFKGGPGPKNSQEFDQVVAKLRTARSQSWASHCDRIASGYVVLAYCDPVEVGKRTYAATYDGVARSYAICAVRTLVEHAPAGPDQQFTCKLLTIDVAPAL